MGWPVAGTRIVGDGVRPVDLHLASTIRAEECLSGDTALPKSKTNRIDLGPC